MHEDDREQIERLKRREEEAFRDFVEKYKKMAYFLAFDLLGNELDAEDASQEAFMKVYTNIGQFRGDSRISSWFYRIVINCCINKTRRKSYSAEQPFGDLNPEEATSDPLNPLDKTDPERSASSSLMHEHIQSALDHLSEKQRAVFILKHYHDLPLQEISEIVGCSVGTVKSQLFRAIRKLQKSLAFYQPELEAY